MRLFTKEDAALALVDLARAGSKSCFSIEVSEEIAFGCGKMVAIGDVELCPDSSTLSNDLGDEIGAALRYGAYEWTLPSAADVKKSLTAALLGSCLDHLAQKGDKSVADALAAFTEIEKQFNETLQDCLRRSLLAWPVFDADAIAEMPLRRPTTIVPDTTAVIQGGLAFVLKFLSPAARIKVPAIVHMEVDAQVDRYFQVRRLDPSANNERSRRKKALALHAHSQGAGRTLVRLELNPDTEVDRGDLGADPLRGVVTSSSDPEDKALGLQDIVRCFADRLIVETALRFKLDARPDHPLSLLASDQGLARMALAEGLGVFFFQARVAPEILGRTLSGTRPQPFRRGAHAVPLTDALWELAIAFGQVHISTNEGRVSLYGIAPSGAGVDWQPLYAKEDLLWGESTLAAPSLAKPAVQRPPPAETELHQDEQLTRPRRPASIHRQPRQIPSYGFTPNKMLALIAEIAGRRKLTRKQGQDFLAVKWEDEYSKYERFLLTGGLLAVDGEDIVATDSLHQLSEALQAGNLESIRSGFMTVPSFAALVEFVRTRRRVAVSAEDFPISSRATRSYSDLAMALEEVLELEDKELIATPARPNAEAFSGLALSTYQSLAKESEWVLTGRWLEELAIEHGVHPGLARRLVVEARDAQKLAVYAEGSTPDLRFDKHVITILVSRPNPAIEKRYLYHGDFLFPGTAAVRVQVKGPAHAS